MRLLRLVWKSANSPKLAHVTGTAAHESITAANEAVIIHNFSYLEIVGQFCRIF